MHKYGDEDLCYKQQQEQGKIACAKLKHKGLKISIYSCNFGQTQN